ncbi:SEC-C metal-binding domain-containing protein [Mesorhizobium sp. M2A.F.Ca.ET.042.01.1.1]|uniref:SEC-C metal-binding domain-containing protein n=1 Tax=Mesorhizobium sp. M2A.F.Ca.ET.042.01.1.1 TaxID=2496745 RepID=UPI0016730226|nr:SEC-C metal-binding domain-containing protein [Mesorhizobium sp. M2A.F.Ca.ET.042.01.1.1]
MPAISTDLFKKNFTTTPRTISAEVRAFCQRISPDQTPAYVPVSEDAGVLPSECFNNVASKVERDGGTLLYGWLIWEWPRVFVEAEHHAVWEHDGILTDITPHVNGERQVLFLPDPMRPYDFATQKRLINIKRSLGELPSVGGWIAATNKLHHAIEANSVGNQFTLERSYLSAMGQEIRNALGLVFVDLAKTTGPNAPCFCTSGRKFKKCCGPMIQIYP